MTPRGYFGVGIYHTKNALNVGSLWRSAQNFGASFIFTIGHRYKHQASDTLKTERHVPLYHYLGIDEFQAARPHGAELIGVEQADGVSRDISNFVHPERAIYLLGAEDAGIPPALLAKCQSVIHISTPMCLNVAVAGSIVLFDRDVKMRRGVGRLAA